MPRQPEVGSTTKGACAADGAVEEEVAGGQTRPPEAAGGDGNANPEEGRCAVGPHQGRQRIAPMKRIRVSMV